MPVEIADPSVWPIEAGIWSQQRNHCQPRSLAETWDSAAWDWPLLLARRKASRQAWLSIQNPVTCGASAHLFHVEPQPEIKKARQ